MNDHPDHGAKLTSSYPTSPATGRPCPDEPLAPLADRRAASAAAGARGAAYGEPASDPVDIDFPELVAHGDAGPHPSEARAPLPKDAPQGLDLLKLWVHQYEAGQRRAQSAYELVTNLAGVIGAWEDERSRGDDILGKTALGRDEAKRQADDAQARCDAAQDRFDAVNGKLQAAERSLARQAETIRAFQEATGIDDAAVHRDEVEVIRPARDEERLTVLSTSSAEKIAERTADLLIARIAGRLS